MSDKKIYPLIIIPGFGQSKAEVTDADGSNPVKVWPLRADAKAYAKRIAGPYFKTVFSRRDMGFSETAYRLFSETFAPFECDKNGNMVKNLRAVETEKPLSECSERFRGYVGKLVPLNGIAETVGFEKIFFFSYNAFDDVYATASRLDAFVSTVKNKTSAEKVCFLSYSMGGTVTEAYFDAYGSKNEVSRVMFIAASLDGSVLQADLITRNVDKNQGYSLLGFATNEKTVKLFKRVLAFTTWQTRYNLLYRSLDAVNEKVMLLSPGMWELLPPSRYAELRDRFLPGGEYEALKAKTDRFFASRSRIREIFREAQKGGTEFFMMCGYNLRIMPLSASGGLSTDSILDVSSPSLGAVSPGRDKTLDGGEELSPDRLLDVSGSFFGDSAVYIRDMAHGAFARSALASKITGEFFSGKRVSVSKFCDTEGNPL